ncbi:hypothetical protein [Paractinoplanes hotanensis]|uniref:Type II toxin-antitoxin system PemK/MazF family toxin n=1 Tax=Paractinoplanes hotanensis TaxID=2906497 RepID=A0ABT0XST2_9ACTN|nr:hypothetical protein [Actinoplanes hotanensis]MCM4076189.1 hypothetical protein [Actinoplanes hotanensis]
MEFRVAAGVTPNFHHGVIGYRERPVAVVLSRDTGIAAVAVPRDITGPEQDTGPPTFVDFPPLTEALAEHGKFTVMTAAELDRSFTAAEWPAVSAYDVR